MEKLYTVDGQGPFTLATIIKANSQSGVEPITPAMAEAIKALKPGESTNAFHEAQVTRIQ